MDNIIVRTETAADGSTYLALESKQKVRATIHHDLDCRSPLEDSGMRMFSFNHRHSNFEHPEEILGEEETKVALKEQRAFMLSAFEHGNIRWALAGAFDENFRDPANMDRFDTARVAGIIFVDDLESWPTPEARREVAANMLDLYSDWSNGECYGYVLERIDEATGEAEELSACWGFVGDDAVKDGIRESADGLGVEVDETFYKFDGSSKLEPTSLGGQCRTRGT